MLAALEDRGGETLERSPVTVSLWQHSRGFEKALDDYMEVKLIAALKLDRFVNFMAHQVDLGKFKNRLPAFGSTIAAEIIG